MQRLEFSGVVRPIYGSLGVKRLIRRCTVVTGGQEADNNIICFFLKPKSRFSNSDSSIYLPTQARELVYVNVMKVYGE